MYNMRVVNYKSNQTLIETKDYTAHLSYGVPQVVVFHRGSALENTVVHNNTYYSNTTSKHKNAYMRTLCTDSYTFIPATPEEIQEVTGLETPQSV
jgi:hypothetical protein|tara:strand:+ start:420 stop:704 length:285 start_codon:yes stop_codon:yes gene_type:complete